MCVNCVATPVVPKPTFPRISNATVVLAACTLVTVKLIVDVKLELIVTVAETLTAALLDEIFVSVYVFR